MLYIWQSIRKYSLPIHLIVIQKSHCVRLKTSLFSLQFIKARLRKYIEVKWTGIELAFFLIPGKGTNANLEGKEF